MRKSLKFSISCTHCGHAAEIPGTVVEDRLSREPTIEAVPHLFELLKCGRCGQRKVRLFDDEGHLLIDYADLTPCVSCGRPIPKPRLAALPDSRLCTSCASEISKPDRPPPYPQPPPESRTCPRCGYPTVVREQRDGTTLFIGCTSYPKCTWTTSVATGPGPSSSRADSLEMQGMPLRLKAADQSTDT